MSGPAEPDPAAFLRKARHDLRNPLNIIIGLADVMGEGLYGELNPEQARSLRAIEESAELLVRQIDDLVDVLLQERGLLTVDPELVDCGRVCADAVTTANGRSPTRERKLIFVAPAGELSVNAEARLLSRAVGAVLTAAARNTVADQELTLTLRDDDGGATAEIAVKHRTVNAEPSESVESHLARAMARLHGGGLEVDAVEGGDTRWRLRLPRS